MKPANSAETESIISKDGFEFKYDPFVNQVTLEAVDYHSGKITVTPDIVQKLTSFMAGKGLFHSPRNGEKVEPFPGDASDDHHHHFRKIRHGTKVLVACIAGIALGAIITKSLFGKKADPSA